MKSGTFDSEGDKGRFELLIRDLSWFDQFQGGPEKNCQLMLALKPTNEANDNNKRRSSG